MANILRIDSIYQLYDMIGYEKPKHPLIALIEPAKINVKLSVIKQQFVSSLYSISLKNGNECKILYGRQNYDFQEGTLMFTSPEQVIIPVSESENKESTGWVLLFHPDLIRKSNLGKNIKNYTFFSYDSNEALHISEKEKQIVTNIVKTIENEYNQNIDIYSHELIISNLELLLNYSKRFYGRQFITREYVNKDIVNRFEEFLRSYFESDKPETYGLPSVKYCAEMMGYSPNYLSDLLKKETGKTLRSIFIFI